MGTCCLSPRTLIDRPATFHCHFRPRPSLAVRVACSQAGLLSRAGPASVLLGTSSSPPEMSYPPYCLAIHPTLEHQMSLKLRVPRGSRPTPHSVLHVQDCGLAHLYCTTPFAPCVLGHAVNLWEQKSSHFFSLPLPYYGNSVPIRV